ncbi:MAG: ester cyclase [Cyanobacteria bacterium P01_G01_bin.4]
MTTDFIITSADQDIASRAVFKTWIANFQSKIDDLRLTPLETFANADGSRVTSRWRITGKNKGVLGTAPDGQPIAITGIAIWAIADGRLVHNWVERSAFELYIQLNN